MANTKTDKPTVDDAMDALAQVLGYMPDQRSEEEDEEPGPTWEGGQLAEIVVCVAECVLASPQSQCTCRCGRRNHALVVLLRSGRRGPSGPNLCKCGCGAEVRRRFLPGHDARVRHASASS